MSSPTDNDDAMKALRAHSLQIEARQSAKRSSYPIFDESQWSDSREPILGIECDNTEAWKRLQTRKRLEALHFDRNGKACISDTFGEVSQVLIQTTSNMSQRKRSSHSLRFEANLDNRETLLLPQRSPVSTRSRTRQRRRFP
jgi:hypothetical protein